MARTSREQVLAVSGLDHSGRYPGSAFAIANSDGLASRVVRRGSGTPEGRGHLWPNRRLFAVHNSAIADGHAEAVDAAIVIVAKRSSGRVNPRDWIVCRSASALIAGSRHESSRKSAAHPDDRD